MLRTSSLLLAAGMLCLSLVMADTSHAENLAVVDVNRILVESVPGKAGEQHLQKVQEILQKGLEDVQKLYKGKENTAEAQRALREAYAALERQMVVERQAVLQVLGGLLDKAVKDWRAANKKYLAVINSQMLLDADKSLDVTAAVMKEMDRAKPVFPDLPQVTVTPPKAQDEKKPAAAPAAPQKKR